VLELLKEMPEFNRGCRIAKLFSKHIKPEEQAELLAAGPVCIGVGTPARLDKLVAMGALSLSRLRLVVLDCSRDAKLRSLLDIPETRRDTWQLWRTHLAPRVTAGHTRIALV
jgi:protein CMS1